MEIVAATTRGVSYGETREPPRTLKDSIARCCQCREELLTEPRTLRFVLRTSPGQHLGLTFAEHKLHLFAADDGRALDGHLPPV